MATQFLLGPQRPVINLDRPFKALDGNRPVAVVSAGWQEAEGDITAIGEIATRPLVDLQLYQRAEDVFAGTSWLQQIYRERQDRLQELQRLYRLRLRQSMRAARAILRAEGDQSNLQHEQRHAISQQRALDRHHLQRILAIHKEFDASIAAGRSSLLTKYKKEIASILADCQAVVITGGNLAVLLNRMRLFDVGPMLAHKHIVAWSAGAMVLTDTVVLFHDNTPQGTRDAEVFDRGLGILSDFVFLPDARHRLKLDDKIRTALFCRRFAPARCLTLDSGSLLQFEGGRITVAENTRRLSRSGALREVRVR